MKRIILLLGTALLACSCQAQSQIRATLEASTNRVDQFVICVTNISSNTVRFLDIREGTGWCGEFYEVTVEKDGKSHGSQGNCLYAPAGIPKVVEILPGKTYDRNIQPGAYVRSEKHIIPPCTISVRYRLTDKIKKKWKVMDETVNLNLTFETNKVKLESSNK